MTKPGARASRRYWAWVARPEYYLDEDGADRATLEPGLESVPGGWWTCHRDTQAGDLVLLYRSRQKKDVAYLLETRSAAYSILDDEHARSQGWDYGCDYQVIHKFDRPLSLDAMRTDPALADWSALRGNFRKRVYEIEPDTWSHLLVRLGVEGKKLGSLRRRAGKLFALEHEIEEHLADNLRLLAAQGYVLEARARQYVCRSGGRADLLCWDRGQERFVVIELKRGLVTREAVGQVLSYMAGVRADFRPARRPRGLLIGERCDNAAAEMIADDSRINFVALESLGLA